MVTLADIASTFSRVDHTCNVADLIDAALRTEEIIGSIKHRRACSIKKCQTGEICIVDIVREGMTENDPRLQ